VNHPERLGREFFERPTLKVARELLGKRLVHIENGVRVSGKILETEAYIGEEDQACHARVGRTPRTQVMYGPPGHAYVYFTYGMHWLFNCVTEETGFPAAVLIRAIQPTEGVEIIRARRAGRPIRAWTDGPGKLTQALGVQGDHHGLDLCSPDSNLFIEETTGILPPSVTITPRVGLNNVAEPWKSKPWRFVWPLEKKTNRSERRKT
jgi:DNA-3-methyladenine glycosylase